MQVYEFLTSILNQDLKKVKTLLEQFPINKPVPALGFRYEPKESSQNDLQSWYSNPHTQRVYIISEKETFGKVIPFTPLQFAVFHDKPEIVKFFLEQGGDLTVRDSVGNDCFEILKIGSFGTPEKTETFKILKNKQ